MAGTIAMRKDSLAKLLDAVLYPNPDDPGDPNNPWGPYGPIGPLAGPSPEPWRLNAGLAFLNPQPLPPIRGPVPDPWHRAASMTSQFSPTWHAAFLARTVIDRAVAQYRMAEKLPGEQSERAVAGVRASIREFVDDCGTGPHKFPFPWPWPPHWDSVQPTPIDLLVAAAQFQRAAVFQNPLQSDFATAAHQLFELGFQRIEGR